MRPEKITKVEQAICSVAGINLGELRGRDRRRPFVEARQAVWLIAHDYLGYSYIALGDIYERDHTTVIAGCRRLREAKADEKVLTVVKKICPEVLTGEISRGARTLENWL
jgi:chromosomal replication initiation ATPase DnaA